MIQKLSQICNFLSGHAWKASKFKEEGIPIIRINNMKPNSTDFKYWDWEEDYDPKYFIEEGDILLSLSGTIKTYKWIGEKGLLNQRIVKITPKANVNIDWVYYQLTNVIDRIANKGKDAMIKNVSVTDLKKYEVDVPDLPTQNKIVAILDKSIALVRKRESTITLLDELLRARFLEMFGKTINDPNLKRPLSSQIRKGDKINYGIVQPGKEVNEGVPVIRVGDFLDGKISTENIKKVSFDIESKHKKSRLNGRELLIACVGATIGKVAVVDERLKGYNIVRATARVNCGESLNPFFLLLLLQTDYFQFELKKLSRTVAQSTLNIKQISELEIPIPSIELQNQFETIYHRIQAQKETLSKSKGKLENLYNSLLQRAFNGQLNFNVDIELDALLAAIDLEQDTEKEKHDIKEITTVYAGRLLERLEEQKFENQTQYKQAKEVVFQMLKEGIIQQEYDDVSKSVKLNLV